ncbi:MAG TPA: DEAD/DEAH box helicase family protein [Rhodanobacteraceae bacterium]|nr:DEAD/DEAH box helicase family protein [Rhodanobacteraceae bacterium]
MLNLKTFQEDVCAGIVARFDNVAAMYDDPRLDLPAARGTVRQRDGAVVLQAPTGAGKTIIAVEALARFSKDRRVLWFWFAPFAGLVEQARAVIAAHAPSLRLLDLDSDRRLGAVDGGGVFVTTWGSVAARNADSRRARSKGDDGQSLDALIAQARLDGVRIGCVVDEAHHGFHKAAQARAFFAEVLKPDYALMMTATPRDADMQAFERDSHYRLGAPADWASVSRQDAVDAGLLKRGVRVVRFVAKDGNAKQLIDFEHLALRECAATHREIQRQLTQAGVALTPLMLVQVPDGSAAQKAAERHLVETLGFAASAVRVHTAAEPDPDLLALANDPTVEVLIFKMAVALGFDAPRAFTLAALRGTRDAAFGVQVIGRIVRRHALLQARDDLPESLQYGYVFLANAASQEGLLDAGAQINALATQAPEVGTQTVLTVVGDTACVQVARSGEPLSLLVTPQGVQTITLPDTPADAGQAAAAPMPWLPLAQSLLPLSGGEANAAEAATPANAPMLPLFTGIPDQTHRYTRRHDAPAVLRSERLPPAPADFEARLMNFVDFNGEVLNSRTRVRERVSREEQDLFQGQHVGEDGKDVFADLAPAAVAERAEQIRLRLKESNDRELQLRLLERFRRAIVESNAVPPDDEELLLQQLDLVLVRHPQLLTTAYRRMRHEQIVDVDTPLLAALDSELRLPAARRALYGVMPSGLNEDEQAVAALLDQSPLVRWWHRNPSDYRKPEAVGLYRWDDGDGFYPDFVLSLAERETPGGIALLEIKGSQFWCKPEEVEKATARHTDYGPVFMVGRERGQTGFHHLRKLGERLDKDGAFAVERLRYV